MFVKLGSIKSNNANDCQEDRFCPLCSISTITYILELSILFFEYLKRISGEEFF